MAAVRQDLTVAVKLNDQFSDGMRDIQRVTGDTFDENKPGSFLSGIKASTVALGAMAVGGIAAVGTGLKSAFDQAREFEQSMADVSAITGATGAEFEALEKLAREMGATTAHSATSAAEGVQFLGMAGFDTDQIMSALPATLGLASAAGMELGQAADISSNILSGMGMSADDLDGVVDKLAQTSRNANTDVGQLGEAFKMVGPTAAAAGVDFDTTTAALGLLANAGLQGSIGGSSLNSALRSMINPSKEAAREAEKLGLTFLDARGKMLPMSNILTQLEDKSVTTQQSFEIFGTEGARAINALRAQGIHSLRALDKKIKESGGVAQDMAETRLGSFDGAVKKLTSGLSEFGISVGETFLPIVTKVVEEFLIPAINRTNEWITAFGGIDTMFRDALTFIVSFKNTAINILTELFNNADFAEEFLGNIGGIFAAAAGVVTTFAVGSDGKGGALGIIIELGKIIWKPLEQGFLAIWDVIKFPLVSGVNFIQKTFTDGINAVIRQINSLGEVFGVTIDEIDFTPITVDAPKTFKERWEETTSSIDESFTAIGKHSDDIANNIGANVDEVTGAIRETAESASHLVDKGMEEVTEKWDEATETIKKKAPADGKKIGEELTRPIVVATEEVGEKAGGSLLGSLGSEIRDPKTGIGQVLVGGLTDVMRTGDFKAGMTTIGEGIGGMIGGPVGAIIGGVLASKAWDIVIGSGPSAAARAEGATGSFLRAFETAGGDISRIENIDEAFAGLVKGVRDTSAPTGRTAQFQAGPNQSAGIAKVEFIKDLMGFGVPKEQAVKLVENIIPKMFQGRGLPSNIVRDINAALTEGLIQAEMEDITAATLMHDFEDMVTDRAKDRLGITPAANGFNGMVSSPTLFLAGEAGPEQVDITPTSRMSGGFSGSGGANFHFNFSVNTIDEQGVKSFIEEDAKPFIVQMLNRESTRGSTVMYSTGLTTDPSV